MYILVHGVLKIPNNTPFLAVEWLPSAFCRLGSDGNFHGSTQLLTADSFPVPGFHHYTDFYVGLIWKNKKYVQLTEGSIYRNFL